MRGGGGPNKFADPSKLLYNEKMNGSGANQQLMLHSTLGNGAIPPSANGTLTSVRSQNREPPRMSLNINPLNEVEGRYGEQAGSSTDMAEDNIDYNLMQHYPHYHSGSNSRQTPTLPLYHQSQNSVGMSPTLIHVRYLSGSIAS